MKLLYIALSGLLLCRFAAVHAAGPEEVAGDTQAKHLAVVAEQRRLDADLSKQEIDCYKRFATNTCLDNISVQRRKAMAILEQEENLVKDAERKARGAQQIRKTREKSLPEKSREGTDRQTALARPYQEFSASEENKDLQHRNTVANKADARRAFEKDFWKTEKKLRPASTRRRVQLKKPENFRNARTNLWSADFSMTPEKQSATTRRQSHCHCPSD